MLIIKMNPNKSLSVVKTTTIYEGENEADTIRFLIPRTYENHNLMTFLCRLDIVVNDEFGNSHQLQLNHSEYSDFLSGEIIVNNHITARAGFLKVWLNFIKSPNIVIKTDAATIPIREHKIVSDFIPEVELEMLDEWLLRMTELYQFATEQARSAAESADNAAGHEQGAYDALAEVQQKLDEGHFDGASAYEVWLSEGNVGSVQEFLLSLKGEAGAGAAHYVHIQISPSDRWYIEHDLHKHPAVSIINSAGELVYGDIEYLNNDVLVATFEAEFSGEAHLN